MPHPTPKVAIKVRIFFFPSSLFTTERKCSAFGVRTVSVQLSVALMTNFNKRKHIKEHTVKPILEQILLVWTLVIQYVYDQKTGRTVTG